LKKKDERIMHEIAIRGGFEEKPAGIIDPRFDMPLFIF
jgi:hypothetical protein